MLDKHEQQLNGEDGLFPRVENLEKWREIADSELTAMKNDMKEMKLGQQDLKNTVNRVENTIVAVLNSQTSTLDKVLTYSLEIKKATEETDRTIINSKAQENVARFTSKEKIIVGIFASIFGAGGVAGLVTAIIAVTN